MRLASCMGRDFQYQELPDEVDVEVDSDWAQCPRTRRSTGGGLVFWCKHLLDSYCQQQHAMSLSSAGAEIHEVVNGAARRLFLHSERKAVVRVGTNRVQQLESLVKLPSVPGTRVGVANSVALGGGVLAVASQSYSRQPD